MSDSSPASSKDRGYFGSFSKSAESEFMPETAGATLDDSLVGHALRCGWRQRC